LYSLQEQFAPAGMFSSLDDADGTLKPRAVKKAALLSVIPLLWMLPLHPQVLPEPSTYSKSDKESAAQYLEKNKHQRRTGILLLVAGVGLASFAASTGELDATGPSSFLYVGALGALGSVPLFISAAKNKTRGDLLLRMQSMPLANGSGRKVTGVGVGLRLGK
jgi:hypothetical protein